MELWKIGIISTISILSYNIFNPSFLFIFVAAIIIAGGFLYFEDKRKYIIYAFIFIAYQIISGMFIFTENIRKDEIYRVKGEFNGKNISVLSINGKGSCKNLIFKANGEKELKGRGEILIRVDEVEKIKNGYIVNGEILEINKGIFDKTRDYITEKIKKISENKKIYGVTVAVIIGDKSKLPDDVKKGFQYTGTAHIIVISGLHIGLIMLSIIKIAEIIKLKYRNKYIFAIFILTIYCMIVGFTPSVARSYIMGSIYILSKIMWEKAEMEKSFWIAYLIILIFNPSTLYSLSFQLSFGAVFALVYIYELVKNEKDNFFVELLKMSFIIQTVLAPFFIIYFGTIPLLSIFANIVAIPLGTVMIQLMFSAVVITTLFSLFDGILKIVLYYIVEILIFYINIFEKIPFMQIEVNSEMKIVIVIVYILFAGTAVYKIKELNRKKKDEIEKSRELKIF